MNPTKIILLLSITCGALGGCVTPSNSAEYHSYRTPAQMDADEARIARMENTARQHEAEDRMTEAHAREVETRHNPTSVSTTTVVASPNYWWW